jgi:hypothetical protein
MSNNEKQKHGFDFENFIIKKYKLIKETKYTGEFDAYYTNIPIQIKCIKKNTSIDFGDYFRNKNKTKDFILIIGFWQNIKTNIIDTYAVYINYQSWNNLFHFNFDNQMKTEMKLISNLKIDDENWKNYKYKYKNLWYLNERKIEIRFKRDHKCQKRIQCAIKNKIFYNFFLNFFINIKL